MNTTKLKVADYSKNYGGVSIVIDGKECSICSVVGYALYNNDDPVAAVQQTAERMVTDKYAGHKMVWISRSATVMTADRAYNQRRMDERAAMPQLKTGDVIEFEGVTYTIAPDHNDNFRLVK